MAIEKHRIILTADMQYKNRDVNLLNSYQKVSESIEKILIDTKADIYAFVGDFTEYYQPNDSERSLMFKHLGNVLNISTLKEMVVMNGNHDLPTGKKIELSQKENNPLNTFVQSSKAINPELSKKINYLKKQKEYDSLVTNLISWVSYSLEDGLSTGNNLHLSAKNNNKYRIPIFHDILQQYVDDKKLPVSKSKYETLMKIEDFKVNPNQKALVLAGDIHEEYMRFFKSELNSGDITFMYPGEPIQRNHGMGSYYKVTKSGPQTFPAKKKYVKQIDLFLDTENIDNSYYEISNIELPNTLEYITISLNGKTFIEDWKEQLVQLLNGCFVSNYTNIIKVEISNIYMKYEMEILGLINEYFDNVSEHNSCIYYINLVYGNVVFDKDFVEIDVDTDENNDDSSDVNFNDILLDQEKLQNIFEQLLESQSKNILKEFTNPDEFNEVVEELKSLFGEQLELSYGNRTSYTIDFLNVRTNGFMALGSQEINLNIPGLTRIIGNNGIGKTTLFNMLRWIIKGMVIEGLPKNTKKENLLLVFNYELPDQDNIINILKLKINGIPVEIERSASRTWKKSTTPEDKKSLNWKEFIDTATSKLTLRVYPKDKDMVVKLNDEAQMMIDQWFGNTIETIFILNQFKISQLLNSSGDVLKETVLDYIGIDYIKFLINNLEIVKPNYLVNKPEKAQMDIVVEKNKANNTIKENITKISENENLIESNKINKQLVENNKAVTNQKLIDIGNVPEILKQLNADLLSTQEKLNSFEVKVAKEIPIFTDIEPVKNETKINELTELLRNNLNIINNNVSLINEKTISFNSLKKNKLELINDNVTKLKTEIENIEIFEKEKFKNNMLEIIPKIKNIKTTLHNELINIQENNISEINKLIDDINNTNNKLKTELNSVLISIKENQDLLDNSICQSCKRPLELTENDITLIDIHLDVLKTDKEKLMETIGDNDNKKADYQKSIDKIRFQTIKSINSKMNWNSLMTSKEDFDSDISKINELTDINFSDELITLLNDGIKVWNDFNNIKNNEQIVSNNEKIEKFQKLNNVIANLNFDSQITEDLKQIKFIEDLLLINSEIMKIVLDIKELKTIQENNEKLLKEINDKYNTEISDYNFKLSEHNKKVSAINTYNQSIVEHNKLQIEYTNQIKLINESIEKNSENTYYYEKYKNELTEFDTELKEINDTIDSLQTQNNTLKSNNLLFEENIKTLSDLEIQWQQYRKKNFIYKTYEKMIKNDFKMAIFNYYRTFLNNKLNILLEGLNFRLYWNSDAHLFMSKFSIDESGNRQMIYVPVKLASGMQSTFLGLSLIYAIHTLNNRNSLSHIFIDEISGQLNSGKNNDKDAENIDESQTKNYQQQLVLLLNKFDEKKIFIVDHVVDQLFETHAYYVNRKRVNNKVVTIYE